MPVRLWHFTWPENVASIHANGFRGNQYGFVYFCETGEKLFSSQGMELLEVCLDLTDGELALYSWRRMDGVRTVIMYLIPDDIVNERKLEIRALPW
jgi:hypothetical protein